MAARKQEDRRAGGLRDAPQTQFPLTQKRKGLSAGDDGYCTVARLAEVVLTVLAVTSKALPERLGGRGSKWNSRSERQALSAATGSQLGHAARGCSQDQHCSFPTRFATGRPRLGRASPFARLSKREEESQDGRSVEPSAQRSWYTMVSRASASGSDSRRVCVNRYQATPRQAKLGSRSSPCPCEDALYVPT